MAQAFPHLIVGPHLDDWNTLRRASTGYCKRLSKARQLPWMLVGVFLLERHFVEGTRFRSRLLDRFDIDS